MINNSLKFFFKFTIIIASISIISFLFYRNYSLYPSVMGDEYINNILSKNTNFKDMLIPSYLYFYFYKISYVCESDYLNCVRFFNNVFFICGVYLTYLLAIKFSNNNYSKILFILLLISPYNIYTAYFLPESMFYFFIWLTFYLTFFLKENKYYYFIIGFFLGICSLIKPHAIFFIPVFIIYFFVLNKNISKNVLNNTCLILSFFSIKLILSLFTDIEFSIFGQYYIKDANRYTDINFTEFLTIFKFSIINFFGIISFLLIVFCLPILILIQNSVTYFIKIKHNKFDNFSIFVLITLIFITINYSLFSGFSVNYHMQDVAYETPFRLNNRYYFYVFPLLLIIYLEELTSVNIKKINTKFIKIFSVIIILILIYFTKNFYTSYHLVDGPLYRGLTYNNYFFYTSVIFSILLIVLYNYKRVISLKIYLLIFLPMIFIFSSLPINQELLFYKNPTKSDQIGEYLKEYFYSQIDDDFLILKIDKNNDRPLDNFKLLMSFDKKNIAITEIDNFLILEDKIDKNLILSLSKKIKYWERKKGTNTFDHYIVIINKPRMTKILYLKANSKIIKNIY